MSAGAVPDADDPDMQLSVPLQPLYEELVCPVCFCILRDCMITPCGHNFCAACLDECLNRRHVCPVCNGAVAPDAPAKNHHVDRLIAILEQQREKASAAHFERLVTLRRSAETAAAVVAAASASPLSPSSSTSVSPAAPRKRRQLTPLEELLHRHMKRCIASYDAAFEDLVRRRDARLARARSDCAVKIAAARHAATQQQQETGKAELAVAELSRECDTECARAQADFDRAVAAMLEGYDRLLGDVLPDSSFVPVAVSLAIPARGVRFPKVMLKPVDRIDDIRRKLTDLMAERGDPIVSWGPDAVFRINGPLEAQGVAGDAAAVAVAAAVMDDPVKALHQYGILPGSEIAAVGTLQLKSDMPRECFSVLFSKDKPDQRVDYFTCTDCKLNWVCRSCAEHCHKGHHIVPYILNHKPTWACCYCAKKSGRCKLVPTFRP